MILGKHLHEQEEKVDPFKYSSKSSSISQNAESDEFLWCDDIISCKVRIIHKQEVMPSQRCGSCVACLVPVGRGGSCCPFLGRPSFLRTVSEHNAKPSNYCLHIINIETVSQCWWWYTWSVLIKSINDDLSKPEVCSPISLSSPKYLKTASILDKKYWTIKAQFFGQGRGLFSQEAAILLQMVLLATWFWLSSATCCSDILRYY